MPQNDTGLQKSIIEYINSFKITKHQVFESRVHMNNFMNYMFRTDVSQNYTNSNSDFNRYFLTSDLFSKEDTRGMYIRVREIKRDRLIKHINKDGKSFYNSYGNDMMIYDFSQEFYDEYSKLDWGQKNAVSDILIQNCISIYSEYLRRSEYNDISLAIVLHADQKELHAHRFFRITK